MVHFSLVAILAMAAIVAPALATSPNQCYHKIRLDLSSCNTKDLKSFLPTFMAEDKKHYIPPTSKRAYKVVATESPELCIGFESIYGRFFQGPGPANLIGNNVPSVLIDFKPNSVNASFYTVDQFGNALTPSHYDYQSLWITDAKGTPINSVKALGYPAKGRESLHDAKNPIVSKNPKARDVTGKCRFKLLARCFLLILTLLTLSFSETIRN